MGGLCTLIVYPGILFMFVYNVILFEYAYNDIVFSSSEIFPIFKPNDGLYLNKTDGPQLDFKVSVNNPEYDNDDNPYGQFRLHNYRNMKNLTDIG